MNRIGLIALCAFFSFLESGFALVLPDPVFEDGFENICTRYYLDADGDTYGNPLNFTSSCEGQPPDTVLNGDDCDDGDEQVNPGAEELSPDGLTVDENCDGVDGNVELAVFVSANAGADTVGCGTLESPCLTMTHALSRAVELARDQLYVQRGLYEESVEIGQDLRIWGGYDAAWHRFSPDTETVLHGTLFLGRYQTVHIAGGQVDMNDLWIVAPNAPPGAADLNSYAVFISDGSNVYLNRMTIEQGHGGDGAHGLPGDDASQLPASSGVTGENGGSISGCTSAFATGGSAGTNPSCPNTGGGGGGVGGKQDTNCSVFDFNATAGLPGNKAQTFSGAYGFGGDAGPTCGPGGPGGPGRTPIDGDSGAGGQGFDLAGGFSAVSGGVGMLGEHGTGGGGGGGGGGCDADNPDTAGGGGGGGGAGGCRAPGGGTGGQGGGSSIGVYVDSSALAVESTVFLRGNGGAGGDGGSAGLGQPGGDGGPGGAAGGEGDGNGGSGGAGSRGGHAGGGGGGAGGVSCGIVAFNSAIADQENIFEGGVGGPGGSGGGGPETVRGEDGQAGVDNCTVLLVPPGG